MVEWTDSRRLFGPTPWLDGPGVVLEGHAPAERAAELAAIWRATVQRIMQALHWPDPVLEVRQRGGHLILAFSAPRSVLLTATELNEWAWQAAVRATGLDADAPPALSPGDLPRDETDAVKQLRVLAELEALAPTSDIAMPVPAGKRAVMVTGSNGKTTTTRLIAAMATAEGWRTGWNCTDGVFIAGAAVEQGDWSGPAGAQRVVNDAMVEAAVLETARGGILRRGLGVHGVDVAVVTNIEADHFGEYGVHSLEDLADAKLVVAKGLHHDGVLVLNADDSTLLAAELPPGVRTVWFSATGKAGALAYREGELLILDDRDGRHILGSVIDLPLTARGTARYNVANVLAASLAARELGVSVAVIRGVLASFGARAEDNAGRLMRFEFDGVRVLVDYAHNPSGLTGLLEVARGLTSQRLLLLLGQAGNRSDAALADLAEAAWSGKPDRIILKELEEYRRGREVGEVPALLARHLVALGASPEILEVVLGEVAAVEAALAWARPGDVLVLPVHDLSARAEVLEILRRRGETAE